MSTDLPTFEFPAVADLLEWSEPRPRFAWRWLLLAIIFMTAVAASQFDPTASTAALATSALLYLLLLGLIAFLMISTRFVARAQGREVMQLQAAEELIQLRRWPEAVAMVLQMLSQPMRTQPARVQALIFMVAILSRYHRFTDAIEIDEYLLQTFPMDPMSKHGLRVGRAMAMLREDHLVDADRALSELRRETVGEKSAGLSLLEIYRDVKTGHAAEAIEIFRERLPGLRRQLGHRLGDALALVARAHDMLGEAQPAAEHLRSATLLVPALELARRYPEINPVPARYSATPWPMGGAA